MFFLTNSYLSAAGLYFLAELVEEYTSLTSKIVRYMIWVSFKLLCKFFIINYVFYFNSRQIWLFNLDFGYLNLFL